MGIVRHVLWVLGDLRRPVLSVLLGQSVVGGLVCARVLLGRGGLLLLMHDAGRALVRQLLRRRGLMWVVRLMLL